MSSLKLTLLAALGAAALTAPAFAATPKVTDGAYVEAERCAALISSPALGAQDTAGISQFLKIQDGGRSQAAYDMGQSARQSAAREARTAGTYSKGQLIAERDGVCRGFVATPAMANVAKPSDAHRIN
jgi:hypothetical protein